MFARLNHVAVVSDNWAGISVFYRALFDLKVKVNARFEASAMSVGDGYVGMNVNPRVPGRQGGFDHFGIQVEDVETVRERVARKYPKIGIIKRPSNRPFASFGIHDPAGNYFDLSQIGLQNRAEVYEAGTWEQKRRFAHFGVRALEPERLAEFYAEIFELPLSISNEADSPVYKLSDGRMTMVILPWRIEDYLGTGIERPAPDHLGFEVENLEAFQKDLDYLAVVNPNLRPKPFGLGDEGGFRKRLFERSGLGDVYMADPDGVLMAIKERPSP